MSENTKQIPHAPMPTLVHCGHHKCLTVFVDRCFQKVLGGHFRNFFQDAAGFYEEHQRYAVTQTSDFLPDFSRLGDYKISRFIRDPRDLIVSGYFYHRRGTEAWTNQPRDQWRWQNVPRAMRADETYAQLLQRVDQEDGLIAEMEFRAPHFESMLRWPADDPRVKTWKYEDIIGREVEVMDAVGEHYGWLDDDDPFTLRAALRHFANRWKANDTLRAWDKHVRDPRPGQWRDVFTPKVQSVFAARFPDLIETLGYEPIARSRRTA